jgi:PAS domain S-box-containing protein
MQTSDSINRPLRILHLEDNCSDAELIRYHLQKEKFEPEILRVDAEAEFARALAERSFDLILADRAVFPFDGFKALEMVLKQTPETPFIFVLGTLGEDLAVSGLKSGATDYVLKDRLARLGPAVRRALRESDERQLRKQADENLRQSQQELADFFECAPVGLHWADAEGRILRANQAELDMFGYASEEYLGHLVGEFHEDQTAIQNALARLAEGKIVHNYEARVHCKNGAIKHVLIEANALWENGKFIRTRSFTRDVTERFQLESQLYQSQKMESVGQLASGIAHDFNNLLAVITGHTRLMLAKENLPPNVAEPVRDISEAAQRAAELTRQLLAFSRKQVLNLQATDLNEIVRSIGKMLQHILGDAISLELDLAARLPAVNVDIGAIEKVLVNLAFNSRHAMLDGGTVRINTSAISVDETFAEQNPGASVGKSVCLTFSDSGCGIAPEHLPRIFEPFFTTKSLDRGTGLGLATVYGIIKQHRGWIKVESRVGEGTTMRLFFPEWGIMSQPFLPGCAENPDALATSGEQRIGGTETILVAESDTPLRELIRHVLEAHGYKVLEAATGNDALELARQHSGKIDALLTDLMLQQNFTGPKLAETLRESKPDLQIIFTTEGEPEKMARDLKLNSGAAILQKPFHTRKLVETVFRCLKSD